MYWVYDLCHIFNHLSIFKVTLLFSILSFNSYFIIMYPFNRYSTTFILLHLAGLNTSGGWLLILSLWYYL